jgi:hypothetical protein
LKDTIEGGKQLVGIHKININMWEMCEMCGRDLTGKITKKKIMRTIV